MSWQYSVTLSSFRDIEPLDLTFKKLSSIHFEAVELYGEPDMIDERKFKDLIRSYDISVSGVTGMWGRANMRSINRRLITRDGAVLSKTEDYVKKCIRLCEKMDGKTFNICLFSDDSLIGIDRNHEWLLDKKKKKLVSSVVMTLRELARYARDHNVELLIEPLNRYSTPACCTAYDATKIIETIADANVGLMLDTFHMNIEEDSLEETIANSRDLRHIHMSDNNRKMPGFGHIDFGGIINSLKKIRFNRFLTFEPFIPNARYQSDIIRSIAAIKSLSNKSK
ncbi:MAG TPA: sugar phosphate isomerase/epimerase family protein [Nitrososphaeraceae archaeon]|jgi:sugar phosphate isomerase/epimerase